MSTEYTYEGPISITAEQGEQIQVLRNVYQDIADQALEEKDLSTFTAFNLLSQELGRVLEMLYGITDNLDEGLTEAQQYRETRFAQEAQSLEGQIASARRDLAEVRDMTTRLMESLATSVQNAETLRTNLPGDLKHL